jgi:hypothetical protein
MEHNPGAVLAIGEIALFLIGIMLSIILLSILLLPSLLRFKVPHWVRVEVEPEEQTALWVNLVASLQTRGYKVMRVIKEDELGEVGAERVVLTRDQATMYYLNLAPVSERSQALVLSMFRQGDEVSASGPTSILAGAGIGWITILCHKHFTARGLKSEWCWDAELTRSSSRPFGAVMYQMLLLNPWR